MNHKTKRKPVKLVTDQADGLNKTCHRWYALLQSAEAPRYIYKKIDDG